MKPGVIHKAQRGRRLNIVESAEEKHLDRFNDGATQDFKKSETPVQCKKGCSACCFKRIEVTYLEALRTVMHAKKVGFTIPKGSLKFAARPGLQLFSAARWMEMELPCIFLKPDNSCAVYEARPLACRSSLIVSNPDNCAKPKGKVSQIDNKKYVQRAVAKLEKSHLEQGVSSLPATLPFYVSKVLEKQAPFVYSQGAQQGGKVS